MMEFGDDIRNIFILEVLRISTIFSLLTEFANFNVLSKFTYPTLNVLINIWNILTIPE